MTPSTPSPKVNTTFFTKITITSTALKPGHSTTSSYSATNEPPLGIYRQINIASIQFNTIISNRRTTALPLSTQSQLPTTSSRSLTKSIYLKTIIPTPRHHCLKVVLF